MSIFDDDKGSKFGAPFGVSLPVGPGKAGDRVTANRMLDAIGGGAGFRTRMTTMPDGTVLMVRTRGGMPVVTRTTKTVTTPPSLLDVVRTFVFRTLAAPRPALATVAIKSSTGMKVLTRVLDVTSDLVSYFVGGKKSAVPTGYNTNNWRDAWRLDGNIFSINNGDVTVPAHVWTANPSPNTLPYVVLDGSGNYTQSVASGGGARSTVVIGDNDGSAPAVSFIANSDGNITDSYYIPTTHFSTNYYAGLYCSGAGVFSFCGGKVETGQANGAYSAVLYVPNSFVRRARMSSATVAATHGSPYLNPSSVGTVEVVYDDLNQTLVNAYYQPSFAGSSASANATVALLKYKRLLKVQVIGPGSQDMTIIRVTATGNDVNYESYGNANYSYYPLQTINQSMTDSYYDGTPFAITTEHTLVGSNAYTVKSDDFAFYPPGRPFSTITAWSGNTYIWGGGEATATVKSFFDAHPTFFITEGTTTQSRAAATSPYQSYTHSINGAAPSYDQTYETATANLAATITNIESVAQGRVWPVQTLNVNTAMSTTTILTEHSYKTRDFIFCDVEEEVYVYLEVALTISRSLTEIGSPTTTPTTGGVVSKYVVNFRGVLTEFAVYSGTPANFTTLRVWKGVEAGGKRIEGIAIADYLRGNTLVSPLLVLPPPVMCAPFTHQGNCPYIAFTTKAEEAAGATSEIYVDFNVTPKRPINATNQTYTKHTGVVSFVAMQANTLVHSNTDSGGAFWFLDNTALWNTLTGAATPFRIQVANNVAGPWQSSLGGTFVDGVQLEIARI